MLQKRICVVCNNRLEYAGDAPTACMTTISFATIRQNAFGLDMIVLGARFLMTGRLFGKTEQFLSEDAKIIHVDIVAQAWAVNQTTACELAEIQADVDDVLCH